MAAFNTFIIDPFNEIIPIVAVVERLKQLADPIAKKAGFDEASFFFPQYEDVKPLMHEILVYVCPFTTSVVKKMPGADKANFPDATSSPHQGATFIGAGETGSEIWSKFSGVDFYAAMIFHEMMHNKMQLGQSLHAKFNPCGMSCATITVSSSNAPTQKEIDEMATALTKPVQQWRGGLSLLWNAARAKASNDPLWNIPISS